jgi:hypothetical protein
MRVLLDTNIFIPLEDTALDCDSQLATLHRLSQLKLELLIHPESKKDIARDKNELRRKAMLSRLKKYRLLDSPLTLAADEEIKLFGVPRKENDTVDNRILFALLKDCVHLLVTYDRGIIRKAKRLGIEERVLSVEELVGSFCHLESEELVHHPCVENVPCYALNIKDPLFTSLRDGYDGFNTWFSEKCCKTGRMAWVTYSDSGRLSSICIYKDEVEPLVTNDARGLVGKTVKLCTFKVTRVGYKLGELLLKQSFNHAINSGIDYLYLTIEPSKHEELRGLMVKYGFVKFGIDREGRDEVFVKHFPKTRPDENLAPLDFAIKYFPLIQVSTNNAYIVPIKPKFHKVLFPEAQFQKSLFEDQENSAGNSILQAYLSQSPIKTIKPGDILFFYRSDDHKAITSYGIVEQFVIESDAEKILQWVAKRTVYKYSDVVSMAGKDVKIILFRVVKHLDRVFDFEDLKKDKIINGSIQSITKLTDENLLKLINTVGIDGSFVSN